MILKTDCPTLNCIASEEPIIFILHRNFLAEIEFFHNFTKNWLPCQSQSNPFSVPCDWCKIFPNAVQFLYTFVYFKNLFLFPARVFAYHFWVVTVWCIFFGFFSRIIHCILFGMQFHFPLTAEFAIRLIYHLFMSSDKFNLIAWMQNIEVAGGKCICCIPHFKCNFWNGQWQKFFTIFSRFPFPF